MTSGLLEAAGSLPGRVVSPRLSSYDFAAPAFRVYVDGQEMRRDLYQHVVHIEYEQTIDMASLLEIRLENVDLKFTDDPIMAPGAEVEVWLGYWTGMVEQLTFVGRAEIVRHIPVFGEGAQYVTIKGYDRSWRMAQEETEITQGRQPSRREGRSGGRRRIGTLGTIVAETLLKYGIEPMLLLPPKLVAKPLAFDQPKGMSDWDLVRCLANIHDAEFWVRWIPDRVTAVSVGPPEIVRETELDALNNAQKTFEPIGHDTGTDDRLPPTQYMKAAAPGRWVGTFRTIPEQQMPSLGPVVTTPWPQRPSFRFVWGEPDSIVERLNLEWGMPQVVTEIEVMFYDTTISEWRTLSVSEDAARRKPLIVTEKHIYGGAKAPYLKLLEQHKQENKITRYKNRMAPKGSTKIPVYVPTEQDLKALPQSAADGYYTKADLKPVLRTIRKRDALKGLLEEGGPAGTLERASLDGSEITEVIPLKVAANGHSIIVVPDRKFRSVEDAIEWASREFLRLQNSFVTLEGVMMGLGEVQAGDVHRFEGIGKRYSGDYYLARVQHRFHADGYRIDFGARKVLKPGTPLERRA